MQRADVRRGPIFAADTPQRPPPGQDGEHPARAIVHHLDDGEVIEWAGKPDRNDALRWGLITWGFFLPWTAFSAYWVQGLGTGHGAGIGDPFALFCLAGLPFLLIGFGGLTLPLWLAHRAGLTLHVITDQRELTFEDGLLTRVVGRRVNSTDHAATPTDPIGANDAFPDTLVQTFGPRDGDRGDAGRDDRDHEPAGPGTGRRSAVGRRAPRRVASDERA